MAALPPREANRLWSYYDVNADLGGYIKPDTIWWYFSFRDQDIAARQVNFPVEPGRTHLTNYTGKATYRLAPGHNLIGFVQAGRNHQPFGLDPFGPVGSGLTGGSAINESEDSTSRRLSWGWIGKLEWNASFGDNSYLELRAGQFGANRSEAPNGSAPRFEDVDTLVVLGGNRDWQDNYRRHQVLGSFSHYRDGWLGSHQLNGGGEIFLTNETEIWRKGYAGDVLHVLRSGEPERCTCLKRRRSRKAGYGHIQPTPTTPGGAPSRHAEPRRASGSVPCLPPRAGSPPGPLQSDAPDFCARR